MISNHYPLTFGARHNRLVLIALCAAGVLIRVYFVARHRRQERGGKTSPWPALLGLAVLTATAAALAPQSSSSPAQGTRASGAPAAAEFATIQRIVAARCAPCHAAAPTQAGFAVAPKGLVLDSPEAILAHASMMASQVATRAMPIGNLTGMTDAERAQLLDWVQRGAPR
jgi:uncharacterized membrane protein